MQTLDYPEDCPGEEACEIPIYSDLTQALAVVSSPPAEAAEARLIRRLEEACFCLFSGNGSATPSSCRDVPSFWKSCGFRVSLRENLELRRSNPLPSSEAQVSSDSSEDDEEESDAETEEDSDEDAPEEAETHLTRVQQRALRQGQARGRGKGQGKGRGRGKKADAGDVEDLPDESGGEAPPQPASKAAGKAKAKARAKAKAKTTAAKSAPAKPLAAETKATKPRRRARSEVEGQEVEEPKGKRSKKAGPVEAPIVEADDRGRQAVPEAKQSEPEKAPAKRGRKKRKVPSAREVRKEKLEKLKKFQVTSIPKNKRAPFKKLLCLHATHVLKHHWRSSSGGHVLLIYKHACRV